mgnify:CR=1 FL=1
MKYVGEPLSFTQKYKINNPACLYKWAWSTIRLYEGTTNSCHRVESDIIPENYEDFHNTPKKLADRKKMLKGHWPGGGCEYCKLIEHAGGTSERLEINKGDTDHLVPKETKLYRKAIKLTPKMVEVYFNNLCNLSCIYCGPQYSTTWENEEKKYGKLYDFSPNLDQIKSQSEKYRERVEKHWKWLKENREDLLLYNILGGEPFFQPEFEENINFFKKYPAPKLKVSIFTNLKVKQDKLKRILDTVQELLDQKKLKEFQIFFSLDNWGKDAEYVRQGLSIKDWENNFNYILENYPEFRLTIHSTLTTVCLATLPDLCAKVTEWNKKRFVKHSCALVDGRLFMHPSIWHNDLLKKFWKDSIKNSCRDAIKENIRSLQAMCENQKVDHKNQKEFIRVLTELDRRRNTNWQETFPWLYEHVQK